MDISQEIREVQKEENGRKDIKQLVLVLLVLWILNVGILGMLLFMGGQFTITPNSVIMIANLAIFPIILFGLWNLKKWGILLGYANYGIGLINSILLQSPLGVVIDIIILYYLYKSRNLFS